ncbi:MAG: holo-ACP synthase [Gammaproteobacteria bacterium]|nr:holo-ACP synthase [Gammaproteobacteria bacterium]NIM71815.1 holo-ACP synthase [Gammaproteobacteria bacterium]NIN37937.1 holo-ACP synthase [Gammaproteobacteria bacterium]NIO23571.1 holo-ACP synthase [Gammaproteobacteria bacterium]NIO64187.1 holo-ACP synthase [Gammaproteobacteria bacterium]
MIFGVGIDLVRISRMQAAIERHGRRFAERILSDLELAAFDASRRRAAFLAKHFAAKEALLKALGTGLRMGIQWNHMEVRKDALGKPFLVCSGRVQELFDERGITESFLSISDEDEYAAAFVTLVRDEP